MVDVLLVAADDVHGCPGSPTIGSSPGEGESCSSRGHGVHCWAPCLPRATPGRRPHTPGGSRSACVGQECEGVWQRSGKQAVPKAASLVRCRQVASETTRADLPVPVSVSSQDLSSTSGCRSSRQEVGLASCGFNCSGLEERGFTGRFWFPAVAPSSPFPGCRKEK